ncbi:MAG: Flagellar hook-associated protein FlgL [Labilithrix sp.]|nr:Flagellar hook-associated protein FlgL [Labilithrix sp.]
MRVTENMRLASATAAQSAMASRFDKAARIASRGSNVAAPSDGAVAFGAKVRADHALSLIEKRSQAATKVSGELDVAEGALSTGVDILSQARAAAVEGANGTMDASSRKLLAKQVSALREDMLGIANTKYGTKYLFGGSKTDSAPFDPSGAFVGNDVISRIPLMDGVAPPANVSGAKTFTAAGGRDVLGDLQGLVDALNSNDQTAITAAIGNIDAGHTQLVQGQTEAGLASERFTSAIDVMAGSKIAVTSARASEVEGDPVQQLTELTLAKAAYERGLEITKQMLAVSTISRT